MFKPVSSKINFPKLEEEILNYWKKNKIFEKSLTKEAPYGDWTFLDGPPFITGLPHYGSLLSSLPKDLFPRYKTMRGYRVRRVWGWDCHGLPAENKVEIKLGIKSKKEIVEKVGVKKFIDECKLYVSQVSAEWEWYVEHIGRWVDFKNAYKTMDLSYMESVLWVFKQMYDKGLIYKGIRVSLYCPHCATPISNFEVAMDADNYKEIIDPATIYKYQLKDKLNTFILAWSTTPWNKIVTPALAVNPKLVYVKVKPHNARASRDKQGNENYILAKSTLKMLKNEPYKTIEEFKGKELVGKKFVPHYSYYPIEPNKKAFEIIEADFVTAEEGTGVVTIAAYGEEDLKVMREKNIHIEMHLDEEGTIKTDVPKFGGMYYLKANKLVNEDLQRRGLVYQEYKYPHNVPLCWRCHTRLYYAPQDAWYVDVRKLKPKMQKTNEFVNWYPIHFKHGRFLKSLESAPDWNISRSRYWGSPVPVWECPRCGERFVPGSIKELEERSGRKIKGLHKPEIDKVTVTCNKCGKKAYRVPEVLDSWIEAGSASFGERHYPFAKNQNVNDFYPPDFIGEYTGQIRAWFYVLHVIANALSLGDDKLNILAKNVLVEGVILGTDGRKMSKNYGNYPDPKELLQKYGGDALRLYLLGSPVMHGEDILISEEQYRQQVRGTMLILWNVYNFFITYANIDKWEPSKVRHSGKRSASRIPNVSRDSGQARMTTKISKNVLDRWIISILHKLTQDITGDLEKFDTVSAIARLQKFVNDLSTWYIRRSRDRVGPSVEDKRNKPEFYNTCYEVLITLCKLISPLIPFLAEDIYTNLTGEESVHLTVWPEATKSLVDNKLEEQMMLGKKLVEVGHSLRKEHNLRTRQPLGWAWHDEPKQKLTNIDILAQVLIELNIEKWIHEDKFDKFVHKKGVVNKEIDGFILEIDTSLNEDLIAKGQVREIIRQIQEERKKLGTKLNEKVNVTLPEWPVEFEEDIKRKALVNKIQKGNNFLVVSL